MKSRGHLNPTAGAPVMRLPVAAAIADLAVWHWIPEWSLPAGQVHRAMVLTYPACNLVVEPEGVFLYGPNTRIGVRELSGSGWAVGTLLRPAAAPLLVPDVREVVDDRVDLAEPELHEAVAGPMAAGAPDRHATVAALVAAWLSGRRTSPLPGDALAANRMLDLVNADDPPAGLTELAEMLGLSPRSVQRIARRYVGITPAAMLRRRRLQDAAQRVHAGDDLAVVAADLGYADQAHLTRDFRAVLGFTPGEWRP